MSRVTDPLKTRSNRMKEVNLKNKEKERMKEREKEAREREARYSNGHLFTSLTVSATTLCSACNKSITAKEALSCPTIQAPNHYLTVLLPSLAHFLLHKNNFLSRNTAQEECGSGTMWRNESMGDVVWVVGGRACNVTIHNRCRDTLANCAKMKQKICFIVNHYRVFNLSTLQQQKLALGRNSSALQNVALRTKTPIIKERPNSAIYPSDSLRQSFLGSRRGRSTLSLSKSVSTNNIAGNLNDDSPLGLRRILSQSTDSLNFRNRAMSMESLNDDGEVYYASMLEELEREGRDFEADSWSLAVDASYLQTHRKDVIKRQDVIYELIQTELHHVRTLRIMEGVFRRGMLEEVLLEPGVVHAVFPCLDQLVALHSRFVSQLLSRRNHSLALGSATNFTIQQLGDVLVEQFSGQNADDMRKCYAEFCSRHLKAVKLYKELLARDKRFQNFIRRVSRGSLLRRHGIQECILLVTQRITKYPVLIQRILDNTKGSEEEAESLSHALTLIRELLSSVDQQVQELELTQKLQEIRARLDPRAETEVRGGGVFRGGELLRRRLLHDKPSVLSLQNLIVRDIANQERGMFLISDSTPPEMYELHAASKEDRNNWMKLIQQAVSRCPSREDFPLIETEDKALLRRLRGDIQQKDREVLELLQERVTLFSDLAVVTGGQEVTMPTISRNVFRADTPYALQAEKLLNNAIAEVDRLSELLLGSSIELPQSCSSNSDQNHTEAPVSNGETISVNGSQDGNGSSQKDRNGNRLQDRTPNEEVCQRLVNLSTHLHALQAAVIRQDSILELCMRDGYSSTSTSCSTPSTSTPSPLGSNPLRLSRSLSRDALIEGVLPGAGADQALLQRHYTLLHDEVCRLRPLEARLRESERAKAQLETQLRELQATQRRNSTDGTTSQRRGSDGSHAPLAPLACQEPDQLDGVQEGSEEEDSEEEEEVRISPRSDSPRENSVSCTHTHTHTHTHINTQMWWGTLGTIRPFLSFDPTLDARQIYLALDKKNADVMTVIKILTNRTNAQRQNIASAFQNHTNRVDLSVTLKKSLSGAVQELLLALIMTPAGFDAHRLRQAMEGLGTDEEALLEVLCTRSPKQLRDITVAYHEEYGRYLEHDLISETSKDFSKLVLAILKKEETNTPGKIDYELIEKDVKQLRDAVISKKTNSEPWIQVLTTRSSDHLNRVLFRLEHQTGEGVDKTIQNSFSGDFRLGLRILVQTIQNTPLFLAQRLHSCMKKEFKGELQLALLALCRSEDG
ncbi:Rho guanine nucleotide exchange factor 2 [Bagarius yarrelli]|uniref:Annexin n=1 Tax=Bagarius yarrelli TaxID=175774 RepID=A0A556U6E7_BAGYA|nr:Rho guanine nucleotide exchange factor 2 [Bagarius yarrelli]